MTPEERFARLDRNYDILVQLLIDTRELIERIEARTEKLEAQTVSLQSQTESLQAQTKSLQAQTKILIELARDHEERSDTQLTWINQLGEMQALSDSKIAALYDAQALSEAKMIELAASQIKVQEAQARSDTKIAALTDSHVKMAASQRKMEEYMARLADSQVDSDRRFNEFMAHFQKRYGDLSS